MKIRTDFVTNSSSSSFILAQKGEWSEKQKEEILKSVKNALMGKKILTPDSTEDEITAVLRENYWDEDEEKVEEIREALKDGKDIYCGWVDFECENSYADFCEDIWDVLQKSGDGNFTEIDTYLGY